MNMLQTIHLSINTHFLFSPTLASVAVLSGATETLTFPPTAAHLVGGHPELDGHCAEL